MDLLPSQETGSALTLASLVVVTGVGLAKDWCPSINVIRRSDDSATADDTRPGYISAGAITIGIGGTLTVFTHSWAPILMALIGTLLIVGVHEYAIRVRTDAPI